MREPAVECDLGVCSVCGAAVIQVNVELVEGVIPRGKLLTQIEQGAILHRCVNGHAVQVGDARIRKDTA